MGAGGGGSSRETDKQIDKEERDRRVDRQAGRVVLGGMGWEGGDIKRDMGETYRDRQTEAERQTGRQAELVGGEGGGKRRHERQTNRQMVEVGRQTGRQTVREGKRHKQTGSWRERERERWRRLAQQ